MKRIPYVVVCGLEQKLSRYSVCLPTHMLYLAPSLTPCLNKGSRDELKLIKHYLRQHQVTSGFGVISARPGEDESPLQSEYSGYSQ